MFVSGGTRTMKHILPLTYEPKILNVLTGKCTQTIRTGRRIQHGDEISFHGWQGKPYRSKWSFRTPYWKVTETPWIIIFPDGIRLENKYLARRDAITELIPWSRFDGLARFDSIDPPTGEELGKVLTSKNKIPESGAPAQIIRWKYENKEEPK